MRKEKSDRKGEKRREKERDRERYTERETDRPRKGYQVMLPRRGARLCPHTNEKR
jgi:hypothetical protein